MFFNIRNKYENIIFGHNSSIYFENVNFSLINTSSSILNLWGDNNLFTLKPEFYYNKGELSFINEGFELIDLI